MVFSLLLQHEKYLRPHHPFLKNWCHSYPKRISFFLWRLANQCLPTDDIVQSVGIFHAEPLADAVQRELGSCFTAWLRSWDCLDAVPWVRSYLPQTSGAVYFITFDKQLLLEPIWSSCYINCLIHFWGAVDCEKEASLWRSDPRHLFQGTAPGSRVFAVTLFLSFISLTS